MKELTCPVCGDSLKNGRCTFCGYDQKKDGAKLLSKEFVSSRTRSIGELREQASGAIREKEPEKTTPSAAALSVIDPKEIEEICYRVLGDIFANARTEKNYIKAFQGDLHAQKEMAYAYDFDKTTQDPEKKKRSMRWYRLASEQGDGDAMWRLGWHLLYACTEDGHKEEAYHWFCKSADSGDPEGIRWKGICLHDGQGCTQNKKEGIRLLKDAVKAGSNLAKINLDRIEASERTKR